MAEAYAVVLQNAKFFDTWRGDAITDADKTADEAFKRMALENNMTKVVRGTGPRVMQPEEVARHAPNLPVGSVVGLMYKAEIS